MFLKLLVEVPQLVFFLLLQVADRDVGLLFDNLLHVSNRNRSGVLSVVFFRCLLGLLQLSNLVTVEGGLFVVLVVNSLLLVGFSRVDLIFNRVWISRLQGEVLPGTSFIEQVDRLVRQEPVLDVTVRELSSGHDGVIRVLNVVVILVTTLDPVKNLDGFLDGWFVNLDWLEPPSEGRILFDLPVFVEGRGPDELEVTPGEGWLQDVTGVHAALGITGTHDFVDFVNEEDDVLVLLHFLHQLLHPLFELATDSRALNQGNDVEPNDFLVGQLFWHFTRDDGLGEAFDNGRLTNPGFPDQDWVVLGPPVEDFDDPLDFVVPPDHRVDLALASHVGQVDPVLTENSLAATPAALTLTLGTGCLTVAGSLALHVVHCVHKVFEASKIEVVIHSVPPVHHIGLKVL